jgi:hypothetical protein
MSYIPCIGSHVLQPCYERFHANDVLPSCEFSARTRFLPDGTPHRPLFVRFSVSSGVSAMDRTS